MALKRQFDYRTFVEGYRTACEEWGIDPEEGATGYQVVHVRAAQERRQRVATTDERERRWWLRHEIWLSDAPYRSETEQEAIWRLFVQGYRVTMRRLLQIPFVKRAARAMMPLREMHEAREKKR